MTTQEIQGIKQRFGIIGNSPALNRDIEVAVQVAQTDLSVLITGESGVGKEHFPQIIHAFSTRKHGPYFAVNCGAIPEGTIESELFGHEKGAFTDARAERKGYFEIANNGTLFLDEVGELPLPMQARLLRVLETGEYIRMGSSTVMKTNVRVVAATNLDMERAIREGRFREDLYYRLNSIEIHVPALRDRREDIPLLFRKFAVDFSERYRMPAVRLSDDANRLLQSYYWNGNIRQLKHVAEQISVLETNHDISAETLRRYLPQNERMNAPAVVGNGGASSHDGRYEAEREMLLKMIMDLKRDVEQLKKGTGTGTPHPPTGGAAATPAVAEQVNEEEFEMAEVVSESGTGDTRRTGYTREVSDTSKNSAPKSIEELERESIRQALERNKGNRKVAASELKISERTLYRKIKEYDL